MYFVHVYRYTYRNDNLHSLLYESLSVWQNSQSDTYPFGKKTGENPVEKDMRMVDP